MLLLQRLNAAGYTDRAGLVTPEFFKGLEQQIKKLTDEIKAALTEITTTRNEKRDQATKRRQAKSARASNEEPGTEPLPETK